MRKLITLGLCAATMLMFAGCCCPKKECRPVDKCPKKECPAAKKNAKKCPKEAEKKAAKKAAEKAAVKGAKKIK